MRKVTAGTKEVIHSITCDVCKVTTDGDDWAEIQEFVRFRDCAGYGARHFTDGDIYEIDICQDCFKNMLGDFARITHPSTY